MPKRAFSPQIPNNPKGINFDDPDAAELGACSGLSVDTPSSAPHFGASSKDWTIAYTAGTSFVGAMQAP